MAIWQVPGEGLQGEFRIAWLVAGSASDLAGDFYFTIAKQALRFGRGAHRVGTICEEFAVGRVHRVKIVEIGQVDLDLDHIFSAQFKFFEDIADRLQYRAGFFRDVPQYRDTGGEVRRDQPGQKGVLVIQYNLAEGCAGPGNCLRLYAS